MTSMIRLLTDQDYEAFDAFLKNYTATSMFLRSNARRAGLTFQPNRDYSAYYWGAFQKGKLTGLIALNWNGNLFVQVPDDQILEELFYFVQQAAPWDFLLKGVLGPDPQARQILTWLNPAPYYLALSVTETSYSLALKNMIVPSKLAEGAWLYRLATEDDLDILTPWVVAYGVEASGADPQRPEAFEETRQQLRKKIHLREIFVLEDQGQCVAKADYNATLPDIYQIGGVWTPPPLRGRGYARAAVAGALLAARDQGVQTGTLFTRNPAAARAYESLGFKTIDHYHITLFKKPMSLR